jgi:pilus assembly protein CpaB
LKRSNRLVLLVGVFLAVVAFVGVIMLSGGGSGAPDPNAPPTELPTVVAKRDIPLGSIIRADQVEVKTIAVTGRDADAFGDVSQVIGQTARQDVVAGAAVTGRTLSGGVAGRIVDLKVPDGQRAMAVEVDQVTGVGTLIKTGDYVDMVIRMDIKPVLVDEETNEVTTIDAIDGTTSKLILQGLQVIGVLLPPVAPPAEGQPQTDQGTVLNDQREIVILSLTPAQVEVVKFVQDPAKVSVSLVLRSASDFVDEQGNPIENPEPDITSGVVLRTLIEQYGVLAPGIDGSAVPATPAPSPSPSPTPES